MRRRNSQSKNTVFLVIVLLLIGIGIAYAVLTEQLTINNTVSYDVMKWDVGFSKIEDDGGTITSTSSITNEGKSITVNCDFGKSTGQETCIVKATITNNGTFDIGLASDPIITYDDTYIHTLTFKWEEHPTYFNSTVLERGFVEKGTSQNVILTVKTMNLTKDMLPADGVSIPITITLDFEEWWEDELPTIEDLAIIIPTECSSSGTGMFLDDFSSFRLSCENGSLGEMMMNMSEYVKTLTFEDKIDVPENAIQVVDLSLFGNDSIIGSYVINEEYTTDTDIYYDAIIQSDTQLYAHPDMSWWFIMAGLEEINGLELLDTSFTTNMNGMFALAGAFSYSDITLDLSNFDTSNVTNMSRMFSATGATGENFELDVSRFDTSSVTDMSYMFEMTGLFGQNFLLALSNFDTSNVNNMSYMFAETGYSNSKFLLDLGNFNTSNVTDMSGMFKRAGYNSTIFTLDVGHFDTSNVTNMSSMFESAGYNNTMFTLDVSNFDTSKVTNMKNMFYEVGFENTNFTLDVSGFDTSKVTDMSGMFWSMGYNNSNLTLDLSNFNTSNVTDMSNMFHQTGYNCTELFLDLSNFDTSKVTNMSSMFWDAGYKSKMFNLDVSNFNTSNVTNMSNMFELAGYNDPSFTLDVSKFDTSNVVNMWRMFYKTGYNSDNFITSLTIKNPNTTSYNDMFFGVATKFGAQFTVNYTSETSDLVDKMIATKADTSNVVKGVQVD